MSIFISEEATEIAEAVSNLPIDDVEEIIQGVLLRHDAAAEFSEAARKEWADKAIDLQSRLATAEQERDAALTESSQILADYSSIQGNGIRLAERLAEAEQELIRIKGLVVERDTWLPDEERIKLEQKLAAAEAEQSLLEFIRSRCKVIFWPSPTAYPIEHTLACNKNMWLEIIDAAQAKEGRA